MNKPFDFNKINQYDTYIINISKKDYEKMQECIYNLTKKYDYIIKTFYEIEKNNTKEFEFSNQRKLITSHKKLLIDIINDVLKIYNEEFVKETIVNAINPQNPNKDIPGVFTISAGNGKIEKEIGELLTKNK